MDQENEASIWPPSIVGEIEPDEPVAYLYTVREVGKSRVEFAAVDGWLPKDPSKEIVISKEPLYLRRNPEVIARNVPQPQILVPQGSAPEPDAREMNLSLLSIEQMCCMNSYEKFFPYLIEKGLVKRFDSYELTEAGEESLAARDVPQSKPEPKEKV